MKRGLIPQKTTKPFVSYRNPSFRRFEHLRAAVSGAGKSWTFWENSLKNTAPTLLTAICLQSVKSLLWPRGTLQQKPSASAGYLAEGMEQLCLSQRNFAALGPPTITVDGQYFLLQLHAANQVYCRCTADTRTKALPPGGRILSRAHPFQFPADLHSTRVFLRADVSREFLETSGNKRMLRLYTRVHAVNEQLNQTARVCVKHFERETYLLSTKKSPCEKPHTSVFEKAGRDHVNLDITQSFRLNNTLMAHHRANLQPPPRDWSSTQQTKYITFGPFSTMHLHTNDAQYDFRFREPSLFQSYLTKYVFMQKYPIIPCAYLSTSESR